MEWINLFFITFHLAFRFTFFQKHMRLNTKNDFQKLNSLVQTFTIKSWNPSLIKIVSTSALNCG